MKSTGVLLVKAVSGTFAVSYLWYLEEGIVVDLTVGCEEFQDFLLLVTTQRWRHCLVACRHLTSNLKLGVLEIAGVMIVVMVNNYVLLLTRAKSPSQEVLHLLAVLVLCQRHKIPGLNLAYLWRLLEALAVQH